MIIWMKVTRDKYEFPVAMADSCALLARLLGTTTYAIYTGVRHYEKEGRMSAYRKVRIEDDRETSNSDMV